MVLDNNMKEDTSVVKLWRFGKLLNTYKLLKFPAWIIYYYIRIIYKCYMPLEMDIGKKFQLRHNGMGCVFNSNVVIGKNVKIYPNCMLVNQSSKKYFGKERWAPKIGDNVIIGGNSTLLGGITIGDKCIIGAGSIIVNNIPSEAKVLPQKSLIIKKKDNT